MSDEREKKAGKLAADEPEAEDTDVEAHVKAKAADAAAEADDVEAHVKAKNA